MKSSDEDTKSSKPRVFLDAVVVIRGVCSKGYCYRVIQHAIKRRFDVLLSSLVLDSARKHVTRRFPGYAEEFERLLGLLPYQLIPDPSEEQVKQNLGLVRDESDVPVALSAINGGADILVSEDSDFIDADDSTEMLRGRIAVMNAETFLRVVIGLSREDFEK